MGACLPTISGHTYDAIAMPDVMSVMTRRSAKYLNSAGKERRIGFG
jgi:hypothetical protein